jgi:hypothetical protein
MGGCFDYLHHPSVVWFRLRFAFTTLLRHPFLTHKSFDVKIARRLHLLAFSLDENTLNGCKQKTCLTVIIFRHLHHHYPIIITTLKACSVFQFVPTGWEARVSSAPEFQRQSSSPRISDAKSGFAFPHLLPPTLSRRQWRMSPAPVCQSVVIARNEYEISVICKSLNGHTKHQSVSPQDFRSVTQPCRTAIRKNARNSVPNSRSEVSKLAMVWRGFLQAQTPSVFRSRISGLLCKPLAGINA